jgi:hypothetical protein
MANSDASAEATDRPLTEGRFSLPRRYVPVPLDLLADTGEPVEVPPPMIEPIFIGFDEPLPAADRTHSTPPPRRGMLARLRMMRPGEFLPSFYELSARVLRRAADLTKPIVRKFAKPATAQSDEAQAKPAGGLPELLFSRFRVLLPRTPRQTAAAPELVAAAPAKRVADLAAQAPGKPAIVDAPEPVVEQAPRPAVEAVAGAVSERLADSVAELLPESKPKQPGALRAQLLSTARQWRSAVSPKPGDGRWFYWGRWAGAAAIVAAVGFFAGFGPFHRPVPGSIAPLANAPSDPALRLGYFQRGAEAGDAEAQLQLAIRYAKGEGVKQDYSIAVTWFRAAAEQGLARAQYDLGVLYERGRGIAADAAQAARWYRKAAEGKYPLAQYNLAVAYTKGEGTRKDPSEAALWYRRAAAQGVVQAMVNLGMLYERGEGVLVSQVDAYAWYLAAGRRGNQPAARRAEDLFGALSPLDQIRAQVLARDVASSIHDPAPATPSSG